jgi:hypothetical protein
VRSQPAGRTGPLHLCRPHVTLTTLKPKISNVSAQKSYLYLLITIKSYL